MQEQHDKQLVPDSLQLNHASVNLLYQAVKTRVKKVLWDPTSVGYRVRTGFTMKRFHHQSGAVKRTDDTEYVEGLAPTYDDNILDPIYRLEMSDANWEAKAHRATRPDVPIPETIEDIIKEPLRVYNAYRKSVPYKVSCSIS